MVVFLSCENQKETEYVDFLSLNDRIGTWEKNEMQDIMKFLSDTVLIRSFNDDTINVIYKINDSILYMKPKGTTIETQHRILNVKNKQVTIDNMYIIPHDINPRQSYGVFTKN